LQGRQNVVEQNIAEGVARTMFCGTQKCRTGIFALTVCYVLVARTHLFFIFYF